MNKIIFLVALLSVVAMSASANVYADKSPYQSGFNHGEEDCDDIKSGVPQDQVYYFKAQYGPEKHTAAFNEGFRDGWYDAGCSIQELNDRLYPEFYGDNNVETNSGIENSFNNRDSVVQPQSQQATTTQSAGCPSQIINGDCIIGQEQKTHNEFAQANRADN